jgi:D-serine deaminase-like pyridoxal phosphate-dependent protein
MDGDSPGLGERVAVVPNHVCTAVNLVPELLVADQGKIVDRWPVAARAANR